MDHAINLYLDSWLDLDTSLSLSLHLHDIMTDYKVLCTLLSTELDRFATEFCQISAFNLWPVNLNPSPL